MERICDHNLERYHLGMVKDEAELAPIEEHLLAPVFLVSVEMNPRTVCFCQPVFSMISCSVAPPARTSRSRTIAFLLNSRGTRGVLAPGAGVGASAPALPALLPFAFRAGLGAAWGAGAGAVRAAFSLASASRMLVRSTSSPQIWMAAQIRVVAALRSVNFLTGLRLSNPEVPAKLFQTSTRRLIGLSVVALLSSFWLANTTRLSCAAGGAAGGVVLLCRWEEDTSELQSP